MQITRYWLTDQKNDLHISAHQLNATAKKYDVKNFNKKKYGLEGMTMRQNAMLQGKNME
jgi:hypothetical protein